MGHSYVFIFFFQAEDGIRYFHVTGVQTCALPIACAAQPGPALPPPGARAVDAGDPTFMTLTPRRVPLDFLAASVGGEILERRSRIRGARRRGLLSPQVIETRHRYMTGARGDGETAVSDVVFDTRRVLAGALFCCVPGQRVDGHDLAGEALRAGAAALLVQRPLELDAPQLLVGSVRAALAPLADAFYESPSRRMDLVGVTGTNGKPTTTSTSTATWRTTTRPSAACSRPPSPASASSTPTTRSGAAWRWRPPAPALRWSPPAPRAARPGGRSTWRRRWTAPASGSRARPARASYASNWPGSSTWPTRSARWRPPRRSASTWTPRPPGWRAWRACPGVSSASTRDNRSPCWSTTRTRPTRWRTSCGRPGP